MSLTTHRHRGFALALVIGLLAAAIGGCGGGGSDDGNQGPVESTGGSGQFQGGNPEIVDFGQEAPRAELKAASAVLLRNFEAREDADFAGQCESLTAEMQREITKMKKQVAAAKNCAKSLKALAEPLAATAASRKNTLPGAIDSLRVQVNRAYALFHGNDGSDYVVPLLKEGGQWRVASLIATPISPAPSEGASS